MPSPGGRISRASHASHGADGKLRPPAGESLRQLGRGRRAARGQPRAELLDAAPEPLDEVFGVVYHEQVEAGAGNARFEVAAALARSGWSCPFAAWPKSMYVRRCGDCPAVHRVRRCDRNAPVHSDAQREEFACRVHARNSSLHRKGRQRIYRIRIFAYQTTPRTGHEGMRRLPCSLNFARHPWLAHMGGARARGESPCSLNFTRHPWRLRSARGAPGHPWPRAAHTTRTGALAARPRSLG